MVVFVSYSFFFLVSCSIKLSGIVLFYIIRGPTTLVCTKKNCFVTLKHHALCTPDMSHSVVRCYDIREVTICSCVLSSGTSLVYLYHVLGDVWLTYLIPLLCSVVMCAVL